MADNEVVSANTRFAFKLYREIIRRDSAKNVFVSPASVSLALAMTYNGAEGATREAMAEALELAGLERREVNQAGIELLRSLEQNDSGVRLAIANSLWAKKGIAFDPDFLRRNQKYYRAQIEELDFADPRAAAVINGWVSDRTEGKIERIIDQVQAEAVLFLINAIYFKGDWTHKFDKRKTREDSFMLLDGREQQHPMMVQSGEFPYYETRDFQAIMLPYGDRRLSMTVFLPAENSSLAAFQERLDYEHWTEWKKQFRKKEGRIVLPRFKLEYEVSLNDPLKQLGMTLAFDPRRADFSAMCPDARVNIDEVKHKTFVEVNEEGTEAAAVTGVTMTLTAFMPSQPFSMVVDRPFFCMITDHKTGLVLFMGSIVEPR
jgi:serine protease inhibitor